MITERERERVLDLLTRSRQTLLEAVDGITEAQARWKPAPERWCILEYIEHLAVSDDALVAMVERSLNEPAHFETEEERREREQRIRETPIPRGGNQAPHHLRPSERFTSLREAVEGFEAARERTIGYARTTREDLRSHFAQHSILGALDGYQWLVGNARHAEGHAGHIREIRGMEGFPKTPD